eukprot:29781_1
MAQQSDVKRNEPEDKLPLYSKRSVIRKEIRSLTSEEKDRFLKAIETMMINKLDDKDNPIPGSSPFYRMASYHGVPESYCEHGTETFPGWHRVYLYEFEQEIQKADIVNGGDGNVFLPYWDWTVPTESYSKDILGWPNDPAIKGWASDFFPADFWSNPAFTRRDRWGRTFWTRQRISNAKEFQSKLIRNSDYWIAKNIVDWDCPRDAAQCLLANEHYVHASTGHDVRLGNMQYPSVETSHNSIHGAAGGYMGIVAMASYDLTFWLHHCNVDRIYQSYLQYETEKKDEPHPMIEFENNQQRREVQENKRNYFNTEYEPFKKPNTGEYFRPSDAFTTTDFGYEFDVTPAKMAQSNINQMLRSPPTYVIFENVKRSDFEGLCCCIHVLIYDQNEELKELETSDDIDCASDHYGGNVYIFGRSAADCARCAISPPENLVIDISSAIRKLGISRYDAVARVYLTQTVNPEDKTLMRIGDDGVPLSPPVINGPLFENREDSFTVEARQNQNKNEVQSAQRFLQRYGYYDAAIDGDYGDVTANAVKEYQQAIGDEVTGVLCPATRAKMENTKRCSNVDPFASNKVVDEKSDFSTAKYKNKKEIQYAIGVVPGYLDRKRVSQCIAKVCTQYSEATEGAWTFKQIEEQKSDDVDIQFDFVIFKSDDDKLRDGPGGILGYGGIGFVHFDLAERWTLDDSFLSTIDDVNSWRNGQPVLSLYYTALHELGHSLGLKHSMDPNDVMSAWYNPKQKVLTDADKKQLTDVIAAKL